MCAVPVATRCNEFDNALAISSPHRGGVMGSNSPDRSKAGASERTVSV